eukprot:scaffold4283_cov118-Skeletonema_marinoi.AAC.3
MRPAFGYDCSCIVPFLHHIYIFILVFLKSEKDGGGMQPAAEARAKMENGSVSDPVPFLIIGNRPHGINWEANF